MVAPLIILGVLTAASILAPIVGREIARVTQPPEVQKELEKPKVKKAVEQAVQEVTTKQPGIELGPIRLTTYDIPGAPAYFAGEVQKATEKKLIQAGYSEARAKEIAAGAGALKIGEGVGEAAGILGISAGSAAAATKIAAKGIAITGAKTAVKRGAVITGKQLTKQVVKASAIAGGYEGLSSTAVSTIAREERLPTPEEALIGTAVGAGTAATGGFLLSKAYLRGKWTGRVADWVGSSLVDPYEKPGDILGGLFAKAPAVSIAKPVKVPKGGVIAVTAALGLSPTETPTKAEKARPATTPFTVTQTPQVTPAITPTLAMTPTESITPTATATTETTVGEPVPIITETAETEEVITPAQQPTEEPVQTPITTPAVTVTPVTVPSTTIQPRMLPSLPLIPGSPPGTGGGAVQKGSLLYYDELRRARALASRLLI